MRIALVLSVAFVSACGGATVSGSQTQARSGSMQIQGPHLARGSVLAVRLDRALDLSSSTAGDTFDGTVTDDARTPAGVILVRAGAHVHGRIVWGSHSGRIYLRDATVSSDVGALALRGALRLPGDATQATDDDDAVRAAPTPDRSREAAPLARDRMATADGRVGTRVAAGSDVSLVLTQPVLVPGMSAILGD